MSMKKLADEAIAHVGDIMSVQVSSLSPTEDEIRMAAMACRIQELEEALEKVLSDSDIGVIPKSHIDHIEGLMHT